MDDKPLTEAECIPNLNTATIAGKVIEVKPVTGKTPGIAFVIGYQKHWPSGVQEIPIKCYISGAERVEKLGWLKFGEYALVHGEVTDKGGIYAHQLERLSASGRDSEDPDGFFQRVAAENQAAQQTWRRR
jgi:hypothetical protein